MKSGYYIFAFFLSLGMLAIPAQSADTPATPKEMRDALTQMQERLSPITVTWADQYVSPLSPEKTFEKLKIKSPPAKVFFSRHISKLTWQKGEVYCSVPDLGSGGGKYECAFDGTILYEGNPGAKFIDGSVQAHLTKHAIALLAKEQPDAQWISNEYFIAAGIWLPSRSVDLNAHKTAQSQILQLLDAGGQLQAIEPYNLNGAAVVRIRVAAENLQWRDAQNINLAEDEKLLRMGPNSEEYIHQELATIRRLQQLPHERWYDFYVDPKMNYAIRRSDELYSDGTLLQQTNNDQFELITARNIWLPRKSRVDYYTWPSISDTFEKAPILSRVFEVSEIKLDSVPDNSFILNYTTTGALIFDKTSAVAPQSYLVAATPAGLETAVKEAQSLVAHENLNAPPTYRGTIIVAVNLLGIVAIGVVIAWRRHGNRV
jgi:hypothetical protein